MKNVPITNIQFYKKKLLIIINGGYGKHKKWRGKFTPTLRPCLVWFFFHHSISVTHHSSLITRHSSLITLNTITVWHHHSISITKYLSHYLWAPYLSLIAGLFFFFSIPKLTESSEKKKRKEKRNPERIEVKKKEKEKRERERERRNPE